MSTSRSRIVGSSAAAPSAAAPSAVASSPAGSSTRRGLLRTSSGAAAAALLGGPLGASLGSRRARAATTTVGFIYVGPKDDYGYNQAHAEGSKVLKGMGGLEIVEEENVPESVDCQKTMESMINLDGASLLFPTSFGYFDPHMLAMCRKFPQIQFRHCGGLWDKTKHPTNAGSYFGYISVGHYLNGIAAGHATRTKKIGFVAAKPIPQVLNNVNAFLLGARAVDPAITCQVVFTGEWSLAVKEAEATNALVDQGVDVLGCHVDGPKVFVQTAAGRGAFVCGYHANQSTLAPAKYLTGAEWNWATVYAMYAKALLAGQPMPNFTRGGLAEDYVKMSPLGPGVPPEGRRQFEATLAEVRRGGYAVIKGPLRDNAGRPVLGAGQALPETAIELESTNYLVEGVVGSTA